MLEFYAYLFIRSHGGRSPLLVASNLKETRKYVTAMYNTATALKDYTEPLCYYPIFELLSPMWQTPTGLISTYTSTFILLPPFRILQGSCKLRTMCSIIQDDF
jgi:hypothetical protein